MEHDLGKPQIELAFVKMVEDEVCARVPVDQAIDWLEAAMKRSNGDWERVRKEFEAAVERLRWRAS